MGAPFVRPTRGPSCGTGGVGATEPLCVLLPILPPPKAAGGTRAEPVACRLGRCFVLEPGVWLPGPCRGCAHPRLVAISQPQPEQNRPVRGAAAMGMAAGSSFEGMRKTHGGFSRGNSPLQQEGLVPSTRSHICSRAGCSPCRGLLSKAPFLSGAAWVGHKPLGPSRGAPWSPRASRWGVCTDTTMELPAPGSWPEPRRARGPLSQRGRGSSGGW